MPNPSDLRDLRDQQAAAPDLVAEIRELRRELYDTRALVAYLVTVHHGGRIDIPRSESEAYDPETAEIVWWVKPDSTEDRCITAHIEKKRPH